MPQQKAATLATVFSDVLADLAFMFTDDECADASGDEQWLETHIGYRGPECGDLIFRCTRVFTHLLASNLLGVDQADDAECDDAVKELMNIICGQLVTAVHGTEAVFDLTIPKIDRLSEPPEMFGCDDEKTCTLSVEGNRVQLRYSSSS